ncbi:hypothetical protein EXN66_Car007047 [Channa argus]|uniref:Uncharacterized protein n=1 Tax=Channa argus TaxID=215402 RepID=A0A6G1PM85_CHAAH|nr:hypothetical protein EXN66_Car007047 [Channa argus]
MSCGSKADVFHFGIDDASLFTVSKILRKLMTGLCTEHWQVYTALCWRIMIAAHLSLECGINNL